MRYQDIHIPDEGLRLQFVQEWMDGNYSGALRILENNPQLDSKKFVADCVNTIGKALTTIEGYYGADFTNALSMELDRFNDTVSNFIYRNAWSSSVTYNVGNFVDRGNKIYLCIVKNTGKTPPNTTYWVELNIDGAQGAGGITGKIQYGWTGTKSYAKNDIVVYQNYMWFAMQSNRNQAPSESSNVWAKFLEFPKPKVYVSQTAPSEKSDGLIWFKIV